MTTLEIQAYYDFRRPIGGPYPPAAVMVDDYDDVARFVAENYGINREVFDALVAANIGNNPHGINTLAGLAAHRLTVAGAVAYRIKMAMIGRTFAEDPLGHVMTAWVDLSVLLYFREVEKLKWIQ